MPLGFLKGLAVAGGVAAPQVANTYASLEERRRNRMHEQALLDEQLRAKMEEAQRESVMSGLEASGATGEERGLAFNQLLLDPNLSAFRGEKDALQTLQQSLAGPREKEIASGKSLMAGPPGVFEPSSRERDVETLQRALSRPSVTRTRAQQSGSRTVLSTLTAKAIANLKGSRGIVGRIMSLTPEDMKVVMKSVKADLGGRELTREEMDTISSNAQQELEGGE